MLLFEDSSLHDFVNWLNIEAVNVGGWFVELELAISSICSVPQLKSFSFIYCMKIESKPYLKHVIRWRTLFYTAIVQTETSLSLQVIN